MKQQLTGVRSNPSGVGCVRVLGVQGPSQIWQPDGGAQVHRKGQGESDTQKERQRHTGNSHSAGCCVLLVSCCCVQKGKSEKELNALRQEMLILSSLTDCAYIIRMLDWFETASELCVVTEFAQGELFEILEDDTSLPETTVRQIAIQLVAGLRYLHAHRIIHRSELQQTVWCLSLRA